MPAINVEGIDHVHVHVANREAAAEWFERVLGLQIAKKSIAGDHDLQADENWTPSHLGRESRPGV
jgi:catechol 2,3-dioxygenase-like lactoylglutathione lyase family enzyme